MPPVSVPVEPPRGTPEGLLFSIDIPLWMPPWNHDDEDEEDETA